jgi:hypothetical protein
MTNKPDGESLAPLTESAELLREVVDVTNRTPVIDMHTHLFAPEFGDLNLFGIDELLTYHYLVAELFRSTRVTPEYFWQLSKTEQADLIWQTLFVENTPISEATQGIVTVLSAFGLDPTARDLRESRAFFKSQRIEDHLYRVFEMAGVSDVVMTNDPLDPREAPLWESGKSLDSRFHSVVRMDRLLNDWSSTAAKLTHLGYRTDARSIGGRSLVEVRRFLDKWISLMKPLYMAVSLPDSFKFPDSDTRDRVIREVVLPVAREYDLPFAMMIGVRRGVNPALRWAGDGLGPADLKSVERMCSENPEVRFLVTCLSRENQHELCVAARKFSNLMPFGCWWFLNNPSIVKEITRERLELLGTTFIAQHSDSRILEQMVYKWQHSRQVIADSLYESYEQLLNCGRPVTRAEIERDVTRMFSRNFREWVRFPEKSAVPKREQFDEPDMVTTK